METKVRPLPLWWHFVAWFAMNLWRAQSPFNTSEEFASLPIEQRKYLDQNFWTIWKEECSTASRWTYPAPSESEKLVDSPKPCFPN